MFLTATTRKITCLCIVKASFIVILTGMASHSFAAAIGGLESITEPEPEYTVEPEDEVAAESVVQLGFGSNISRVSFSDDIGQTSTITSVQAMSIYLTNWLNNDTRYLAQVHVSKYGFDASESHIGQEINQQGFRFSVQKNTTITNEISPWLGGGLELSYSSLRKRHSVDSEGFLVKTYDNEAKPGLGLLLNIMQKWKINNNMAVAAKVEYSIPVVQSVSRIAFGVILFFDLHSNLREPLFEPEDSI